MNWFLIALVVTFGATAFFLGSEMMKKFGFMREFILGAPNQLVIHEYTGSIQAPGMCNIRLTGSEPFSVLIGFELTLPFFGTGFDYFGRVASRMMQDDGQKQVHDLVVSLWLGKSSTKFMFLVNRDASDVVVSVDTSHVDVDVVYPPHWWQRLGFYS